MWLRNNVCDPYGNLLFCSTVLKTVLGVSTNTVKSIREKKRLERERCTIVQRRVGDVLEEHLVSQVMVPPAELAERSSHDAVRSWLKSLHAGRCQDSQSQYTHGLQNRRSNRALSPETYE